MNLPEDLRPLEYHGNNPSDRQPHDESRCQRCQELGHSCKNAPPIIVEVEVPAQGGEGEDDDNVSVTCSDTSDDSSSATLDDEEEERTPVVSEDEAEMNEKDLEKGFENLKL